MAALLNVLRAIIVVILVVLVAVAVILLLSAGLLGIGTILTRSFPVSLFEAGLIVTLVAGALALLITKIVSGMMSIPSTPATEEEWEPEDEEWEFEDEDEEEEDQPPSIPLWQRKISQKPSSEVPPVGRNDPCPCGSGKKYKHCHGQNK